MTQTAHFDRSGRQFNDTTGSMRSNFDFSSWQGVLSTLLGLVLVSFVAIGIRLLLMHGVQLRRERQNRQINERLKTLIAAYKVLGGSFTGDLAVDPRHLRDLRRRAVSEATAGAEDNDDAAVPHDPSASDRRRRMRDAVEAALSDVILLGTHDQVRLAAIAANEMVAGRSIETAALVTSLRNFIRDVLDLEAIPGEVLIPAQGPARTSAGSARAARKPTDAGGGGRGAGGDAGRIGGGGGHAGGEGAVDL